MFDQQWFAIAPRFSDARHDRQSLQLMACTGHSSIASSQLQVSHLSGPITCDFSSTSSNTFGQIFAQLPHPMQVSSSTTGVFGIKAPSSKQFKVLDELLDLYAEIKAFDAFHAVICVLLFQMGRKFFAAFFEIDDIRVLPVIKMKTGINAVLPDLRIHFDNLAL
jgi:hypothetical protein